MNTETASKIAQYLLEAKAVKLNIENPYTWSSGWKSPIYCDNRVILSYPEIRNYFKINLANQIKVNFSNVDVIVGVATAGIAIGALVADVLNLPFAYARPKPKEHGLQNQIEGKIEEGKKIVVIEDLISTGGSSLNVVKYLRYNNYNVIGLAAIFTYGFDVADENFKKAGCKYFALSNYNILIDEAIKSAYIKSEQLEKFKIWRENPSNWG
ncbi:MAG: orotate phosphoribosyltransferase [Bacteroidia bacterium]|nr:orotate phosphoribosyltransferase [Bacteroidia bacterium]